MTRNPEKSLPDPSDSTGHRQIIVSIEYTISTTMPGKIGLASLEQFGEQIVAAIEYLRNSGNNSLKMNLVISSLEKAKIPLQIAIDEAHPRGNSKRRYVCITEVGTKLKEALKNWEGF